MNFKVSYNHSKILDMSLVSVNPTLSKEKEEFAVLIYLVLTLQLPASSMQ